MNGFWNWWQHLPQHMNPVIFHIGGFKVQYYGLMYLVAFGLSYVLAVWRVRHEDRWTLSIEDLQGLMTAMAIGLIIGARLGYVIFYNLGYYIKHPLEIILPFSFENGIHFTGIAGMSYHGGLICTIIGAWWYIRKHHLVFRDTADLLIPCIPAGYTLGRLGNFINGELWGRITTAPIGMYFPNAPGEAMRYPSQLFEAFGEGVLLFILLWSLRKHVKTRGAMLAIYLIGYGMVRFIIEFFRQPDIQLGLVLGPFSMGQVLCSLMIIAGLGWWIYVHRASLGSGSGGK